MNRWIIEVRKYQYSIKYIKRKKNMVANSLSRPILVIQQSHETTQLGKNREKIRTLQKERNLRGNNSQRKRKKTDKKRGKNIRKRRRRKKRKKNKKRNRKMRRRWEEKRELVEVWGDEIKRSIN